MIQNQQMRIMVDDCGDFTSVRWFQPTSKQLKILLGPGQDHSFAKLITQFVDVNVNNRSYTVICPVSLIESSNCISIAFRH